MTSNRNIGTCRQLDGYAGVIPPGELNALANFAVRSCRHHPCARQRRCARTVLHSLVCPCAWTEDTIIGAIEEEIAGRRAASA